MSGQELPTSTTGHGAFAFPDAAGTRLIVTSTLPEPERLETVLCRGNVRGQAVFERWQAARQGGTGRQSPRNFADLAGSVFRVKTGKLDETGTCFLATGSLLSDSTVVPVARPTEPAPCTPDARSSLASLRGRPVVNCWVIARLNEDGQIVLAEFARQGNDALASVVLTQGGRSIFADYAAKYRGRGQSLWRVDDGGVLSPAAVEVVFLVARGSFRALGISWSGAEGLSLSVFVADRQNAFAAVIKDYWYRAPM